MINTTKLKVLADAIEQADKGTFGMEGWFFHPEEDDTDADEEFVAGGINPHCGTAGCIAGWACNIFLPPGEKITEDDVRAKALDLLGAQTSEEESLLHSMFISPSWWRKRGYHNILGLQQINQRMAADELRKLAEELA